MGSRDGKEDGSISINGKIGSGCRWIGGEKLDGAFNWKGACEYRVYIYTLYDLANSTVTTASPIDSLEMLPGSFIQSLLGYFQPKSESTHLFPNMFLVTIPRSGCWLSLSFIPISERATSVRYDVYGAVDIKDETAQAVLATVEGNVKSRVSKLETEYQSCLNSKYVRFCDIRTVLIIQVLYFQGLIWSTQVCRILSAIRSNQY